MAVGYPTQEVPFGFESEELLPGYGRLPVSGGIRIDGLAVAAVILLLFLGFQLVRDRGRADNPPIDRSTSDQEQETAEKTAPLAPETAPEELTSPVIPDMNVVVYPYDSYWVTQGPHGYSYGHMAIDLAAGKGSTIKSPIFGTVTASYIDQYGNTTLVIENQRYQVTMLHGDYSVSVGKGLYAGDPVGTEGNNGYTLDWNGQSCRGRDCGYHTHINVFDKSLGQNVNPLDVLAN